MEFGVFDHLDRTGQKLPDFYEDRLKIAEAYDRAGFYAYHIAEHHSTPARHGAVAEYLPRRRRAAHQAAALRAAGVRAAALSPGAADCRNLHARPDEQRPFGAVVWPRCLADRGRIFRPR